MANKAKVAVLSLLTLSSLAVVSLAAVVSSKGFDSLGNNPSVKPSLLTEHDGAVYTEAVVNDRATIDIKIQNAYIDEGVAKVDGNNYYVISNEAGEDNAIRGIRSISYTWTHSSIITESENVGYAVYYSYNHLTVEDIFAGKYVDMKRFFNQRSVIGQSVELSTESFDIDGAACRYFLIIIESPSVAITLDDFSVDAYCSAEPSPKEIGEWTSYPEGMIDELGGITSFPFVENGSWLFNSYGGQAELAFFQQKSTYNVSWFNNVFVNNGFDNVAHVATAGIDYWQKPSSGDLYYTYMVRILEPKSFIMVNIAYVGESQSMESASDWPSNKINEALTSSEFKSKIFDPELAGEVTFMDQAEGSDYKHTITIGAMIDKDEGHLATNKSKLKAYINKFVNDYGFEKQYEYDYSTMYQALAITSDLNYYVSVMYMNDPSSPMAIFTFDEYHYGSFPTAAINSKFDSKFPTFASSEGTFCLITTSSNNYNVQAKGITRAEISTYLSTLSGLGFEVCDNDATLNTTSSSGLPIQYKLQISESNKGSYVLRYYVNEPNSYSNFSDALRATHLPSDLADEIVSNSGLLDGEFYVSNNQTVYCKNWGSDEYNAIINGYTYNEFLDGYLISSGSSGKGEYYVIQGSAQSSFLVLNISSLSSEDYSIISNLVGKSDINDSIDSWANSSEVSDASSFYVVRDSICYYSSYSGYIKVCAKDLATINSIRDEYVNSLTSNTNIKHSSFDGRYYNVSNNTAADVSRAYNSGTYCYYYINLYASTTYKDYVDASTFLSSISNFTYMDAFPSLIKDSGSHYLLELDEEECLEFYVDDTIYSAYIANIESSTTFVQVEENVYRYVDSSNNLYKIEVNHSEGKGYFRFNVQKNYYKTMIQLQDEYSKSKFFTNFITPQDTDAIFHVQSLADTDATIEVDPYRFDFDAYKTLLINNGYDFDSSSNTLTKTESDSMTRVAYNGTYLNFTKAIFNKLSYSEFVSELESNGFETERLDNFVTTEAMENNYCINYVFNTQLSVVIVNTSFTLSDYRTALLNAGYNELSDNHFSKGTSYVSLSTSYGFVRIDYQDSRQILYTWSEIETQIKNKGSFPEWKLDELTKPTQSGKLFILNSQYSEGFYISYSDDFDVDAYVSQLEAAGYTGSKEEGAYYSYSLGSISVNIDCKSKSISFSHYGEPKQYLTDELLATALKERGFSLSNNISVYSDWVGEEVMSYDVYTSEGTIYVRFFGKSEIPSDGQVHYATFGGVYVEYEIVDNCYEIRINDLGSGELTTLESALSNYGFPLDSGVEGYEDIASLEVNRAGNYVQVSNAEDTFNDLYAYYQACETAGSVDSVEKDGDVIIVNYGGNKFSIELINDSIIRIGRINY